MPGWPGVTADGQPRQLHKTSLRGGAALTLSRPSSTGRFWGRGAERKWASMACMPCKKRSMTWRQRGGTQCDELTDRVNG
jgi:hypothetical protein